LQNRAGESECKGEGREGGARGVGAYKNRLSPATALNAPFHFVFLVGHEDAEVCCIVE